MLTTTNDRRRLGFMHTSSLNKRTTGKVINYKSNKRKKKGIHYIARPGKGFK
jgi:hypothetical protein